MKINAINGYRMPALKITPNAISNYMSTPVLKADSVSFTSNKGVQKQIPVDVDTAKFVANSLSTSTSGHRAPYGSKTFNQDVVKLLTLGVAEYAKGEAAKNGKKRATVLIGGDTRKATRESLPRINETLQKQNIDVIYIKDPVPTPLLALAAKNLDVDISVLMTASHNPWDDGGYNIVTKAGAIAPASVTQKIAKKMNKLAEKGTYTEYPINTASETVIYPDEMYKQHINSLGIIDWNNLKNSNIALSYDSLDGTGGYVLPKLLKSYGISVNEIHSTGHEGPNPIDANFADLKKAVANDNRSELKVGIANDGDADRFGIVDENGKFIPANDVLLLASYHLAKNKGYNGAIVRSQATTKQLDGIASQYGLDVIETPVGFKYIAEDILEQRQQGKDILLAGEESGGLTIHGHLPEKDGILADLLVLDLIATEKKPISQILKEVKAGLPVNYEVENFSKKCPSDEEKQIIMDKFKAIYDRAAQGNVRFDSKHFINFAETYQNQKKMGKYKKGGDGIKLFLTDGSTILVRKSGTEPLLKCYIEAAGENQESANENRANLRKTMDSIFTI